MNEENKKEILTREIVKKELKEIYVYNLLFRSRYILLFLLGVFGIGWLIVDHLSRKDNYADAGITLLVIQYGIVIIAFFVLLSIIIYTVYKFVSLIFWVSKDKFDIEIDKLVNKEKDGRYKYHLTEYSLDEMELHDHRKPYVFLYPGIDFRRKDKIYVIHKLLFAKYKVFYIPEGRLYHWSDKYRMEHWAVYRWAEIGDEFYVVTVKNKVLYVYNTKHFELQD